MGLPYTTRHAGQIYFGPDGNLYFMMGDGGNTGDPWNFAQTKKSVLGKTMRINVDVMPSMNPTDIDLNYSSIFSYCIILLCGGHLYIHV